MKIDENVKNREDSFAHKRTFPTNYRANAS